MGYIYKISNDINTHIYIGQTTRTLDERFKLHIKDSKKDIDRPLYRAMKKYGIEHFSIELIEEVKDELLNDREIYWITYYNSYNEGYNATLGGDGKHNINYNTVIENYLITNNMCETARQLGIDRTTVEDILHGKNIKTLSAGEVSKKINNVKVAQIDKNTNQIIKIFSSLTEAEAEIPTGKHICDVCKGKRITAGGYKWKYVE